MPKALFASLLLLISVLILAGCGGQATPQPPVTLVPGDAANGKELFAASCIACHGPNGEGVQGLAGSMQTSEFIKNQSDEQLLDFIKKGRPASDPANTTGVNMPPKGGIAKLTDQQIMDIIAFIRSISAQ